jgi:hypothetical protein
LDHFVSHAEGNGMKIFLSLSSAPPWASTSGKTTAVPNREAWMNFVRVVVSRYRGRVHLWGIGNEPNLEQFWDGTTADYVNVLLKPAHAVIKALDSQYQVAGPELALLYKSKIPVTQFVSEFKKLGGANFIDVFTHHAYGRDVATFKKLLLGFKFLGIVYKPGLKQLRKRAGAEHKPFWLTEFGWDAISGEDVQASQLKEALKILKGQAWIQKAFVYELVDDPRYVDSFRWGLLRADGTSRPAVEQIQDVMRIR